MIEISDSFISFDEQDNRFFLIIVIKYMQTQLVACEN